MTGFSIENSFLSDDESRRLYARFPELKKGICYQRLDWDDFRGDQDALSVR